MVEPILLSSGVTLGGDGDHNRKIKNPVAAASLSSSLSLMKEHRTTTTENKATTTTTTLPPPLPHSNNDGNKIQSSNYKDKNPDYEEDVTITTATTSSTNQTPWCHACIVENSITDEQTLKPSYLVVRRDESITENAIAVETTTTTTVATPVSLLYNVREKEMNVLMDSYRMIQESALVNNSNNSSGSNNHNKQNSKIVLIRGELGTGKTTLARIFDNIYRTNHTNAFDTYVNKFYSNTICTCCTTHIYLHGTFEQLQKPQLLYHTYSVAITDYIQYQLVSKNQRLFIRNKLKQKLTDPMKLKSLFTFIPKLQELLFFMNSSDDDNKNSEEEKEEERGGGGVPFRGYNSNNNRKIPQWLDTEQAISRESRKIQSIIETKSSSSYEEYELQKVFKYALSTLLSCFPTNTNNVFHKTPHHLSSSSSTTTTTKSPVIVFVLDDIHWANETDLDLLYSLVSDPAISLQQTLFLLTVDDSYNNNNNNNNNHHLDGAASATNSTTTDNNKTNSTFTDTNVLCLYKNTLDKLKNEMIYEITLQNLTAIEINSVLSTRYGSNVSSKERMQSLAHNIWKQTNGNFYSMISVLQTIESSNNLMNILADNNDDSYNNNNTQVECCSDNIILTTINEFSEQTQEDIQIVSCIGASIDTDLIHLFNRPSLIQSLEVACDCGIMMKQSIYKNDAELDNNDTNEKYDNNDDNSNVVVVVYTFVHEKVQQVLYKSIPSNIQEQYHLYIGKAIWKKVSIDELTMYASFIVKHIVQAQSILVNIDERIAISRFCLLLGEQYAKYSSFVTARYYLYNGIQLLDTKRCWFSTHDNYQLTVCLYSGLAECCFSSGYINDVHEIASIVIQHAKCFDDTIRIRLMLVNALGSIGQFEQARLVASDAIRGLGEYGLPKQLRFYHHLFIQKYLCMKHFHLLNQSSITIIDTLMKLPIMTNPNKLSIMQFLNMTIVHSMSVHIEWVFVLALRMITITFEYGISDISCFGFILLGYSLCSNGNNVNDGYRFGQIGYYLYQHYPNRNFATRFYCAYYNFIHTYKFPITECIRPLQQSYQVGLETGDNEVALISGYDSCMYSLEYNSLVQTEQALQTLYKHCTVLKQEMPLVLTKPLLYAVQHLIGNDSSSSSSSVHTTIGTQSSSQFNNTNTNTNTNNINTNDQYRNVVVTNVDTNNDLGSPMIRNYVLYPKILIHYLFGNMYQAMTHLDRLCNPCSNKIAITPHLRSNLIMLYGLCCIQQLFVLIKQQKQNRKQQVTTDNERTMNKKKRQKYRKVIHQCLNCLRQYTKHEPYSNMYKEKILDAEYSSLLYYNNNNNNMLDRRRHVVIEKYMIAIAIAKECHSILAYAITNELYAKFALRCGRMYQQTVHHIRLSIDSYKQWGAYTKIRHLQYEFKEQYQVSNDLFHDCFSSTSTSSTSLLSPSSVLP